MKFFITLCVLFGFCMSAFGEEAYLLKYLGRNIFGYTYQVTSKVDFLSVDRVIANRGNCDTYWDVINQVNDKDQRYSIKSNKDYFGLSNAADISNKMQTKINNFFFEAFGSRAASVYLEGFGKSYIFTSSCKAIEMTIVTNYGEKTFTFNY